MDIHDWILIASLVLVAIGWFVNNHLNRQHEIARRRTERRLETLQAFLPLYFAVRDNIPNQGINEKIIELRSQFHLYCYRDEIEQFEKIISSAKAGGYEKSRQDILDTGILVRDRIRKELGLDKDMDDAAWQYNHGAPR